MDDLYKLHYFNGRGLAEPIRIILSYAEANWEDLRFSEIPAEIRALAPYGQVPLLEYNGQIISQSQAATRFVARKFNLVGSSELESAKCDEIVDAAKDFVALWQAVAHEKDENKKAEGAKNAAEVSRTRFLSKFDEILKANGNSGHFVGSGLTWADIVVAYALDNILKRCQLPLVEGFEALQKLIQVVFNEPKIARWIKERPETPF